MITVEIIRSSLDKIRAAAHDYEQAHGLEDDLHQDVLKAIAAGAANPVELAAEAIKSIDIKFARYCS